MANYNCRVAAGVKIICRVNMTVGKHIVAEHTLAGGCIAVRADESAGLGIVVAGPKVVEPGFLVVVVAPVADGVNICQSAGSRDHLAIRIVLIA